MCSVRKSSNFCSRMLEMHVSEKTENFETFSRGKCCQTPPETCEFFPSLPTPKLLVPCLELIENPALCYRKESPRAVMKGWKQFYH